MSAGDGPTHVYFHVGRYGHPYFNEQLRAAPEGFCYASSDPGAAGGGSSAPRRVLLQGARLARGRERAESAAIRALSWSGYVRSRKLALQPDCSLVHSAQLLLRSPEQPYVLDFECIEVFSLYQRVALRRPWARARLLDALLDERCRFLLPWSEAARRGISSALGADAATRLAPKTLTVLPAIAPRAQRPAQRAGGPLRVLFVGTAFEAKGGVETIRAVRRVRESHDVELDIVSNVPPRWHEEASRCPGTVVHDWPVSHARLGELFGGAHLLVFPSHMDTLGFVMLEAMAHGMPVLATRHFAAGELVEDRVSGLLVDGENPLYGEDGLSRFDHTIPLPRSFRRALASPSDAYVDRLAGALATVAGDQDLHSRLAAGALARVVDGALSVGRRREALGTLYRRAGEPLTVDSVSAR
jgi:glycosyltransferase involved in cell wall biosynthesis